MKKIKNKKQKIKMGLKIKITNKIVMERTITIVKLITINLGEEESREKNLQNVQILTENKKIRF